MAPESSGSPQGGWSIIGAIFINLAMLYGVWYSYSVFLVALLREFGWDRSVVAGGFSVFLLIHGSVSPMAGWLAERLRPRRPLLAGAALLGIGLLLTAETTEWWHLYVAFGGITAMGVGIAGWVPSVVIVRGWFPDRVGTAVGIASAGIGVGISGLVPLAQFLIEWCGWRWAFRILAVLIVGWVVPATVWLIRDPPTPQADSSAMPRDGQPLPQTGVSWTLAHAVRDRHYWALAGVFFTGNVVTQMLLVHQVAYLVDHGMPVLAAAAVGSVVGVASIVGKMTWGVLSDRTGREVAYSLAFGCVVASIGVLALAGAHPTSALPYLYGVLIGLGYGGTSPLTPAAASDLFSGPNFATIFGTLYALLCLGAAVGSWGAGKIFDLTGGYAAALWVAFASALLAPMFMWLAAPRHPHPPPDNR
ncbi:MAG: MFS transporter [candidate division NC10 bacterium]|nr:MFS transporter [candidate division NC10 bacterium]